MTIRRGETIVHLPSGGHDAAVLNGIITTALAAQTGVFTISGATVTYSLSGTFATAYTAIDAAVSAAFGGVSLVTYCASNILPTVWGGFAASDSTSPSTAVAVDDHGVHHVVTAPWSVAEADAALASLQTSSANTAKTLALTLARVWLVGGTWRTVDWFALVDSDFTP